MIATFTLPPGAIVYVRGLPFKTVKKTELQGATENVRAALASPQFDPLPADPPLSVLENEDTDR